MYLQPNHARTKATVRMIAASFAAGACGMLFLGLAAPLAARGALSVVSAEASTVQREEPLIEPLDVEAVRAQLAAADQSMQAMRATTDDDIERLSRLTRR